MKNEVVKAVVINNEELEKVINESGLELSESEMVKQSYISYFEEMAEIKAETSKIGDPKNPTLLDEKIASDLRKRFMKVRTGSKELKDSRKKIHLLKGNLEQTVWNTIEASCLLEEEYLRQIEKNREIAEKAAKEQLKAERQEKLATVCDNFAMYPLAEISEEAFNDLFEGQKLMKEQKEKAEKEEAERIANEAKEKAIKEALRAERKELLIPVWNFIEDGVKMSDLAEIESGEFALVIENAKALQIEQEKENERLRIEAEKAKEEKAKLEARNKEREIKIVEREKEACYFLEQLGFKFSLDHNGIYTIYFSKSKPYQSFLQYRKDKFYFEEQSSLESFKKQVESELKLKKQEDEIKIKEHQDFVNEQERLKAEEEAKKAPVKDQMNVWVDSFSLPSIDLDNEQYKSIIEKFNSFKKWAKNDVIEKM